MITVSMEDKVIERRSDETTLVQVPKLILLLVDAIHANEGTRGWVVALDVNHFAVILDRLHQELLPLINQ